MTKFDTFTGTPRVKIMGIGGYGANVVESLIASGAHGAEFVVVSPHPQTLQQSSADKCIRLGSKTTRLQDDKVSPENRASAALEARANFSAVLEKTDLLIITAGLGGATGSGVTPVVAELAKEKGILCIIFVITPFSLEGPRHQENAERTLASLKKLSTTVIVTSNEHLIKTFGENATMLDILTGSVDMHKDAIRGMTDAVCQQGIINVDFAEIKALLAPTGRAVIGRGIAKGESGLSQALCHAIASTTLEDVEIAGAQGLLVTIVTNKNFSAKQLDWMTPLLRNLVTDNALIIINTILDMTETENVTITLLATGLEELPRKTLRQSVRIAKRG